MSFTPRTSYGNFGNSQWMSYAVARTGVSMPNCFTYATARISEIVGSRQSLDGSSKVVGAGQLWATHASEFVQSGAPVLGALMIFQGGVAPYYYGHVAVVEGISGGRVTFSESSYQEFNFRLNSMSSAPGSYYPNGYGNLKLIGYLVHKSLTASDIKLINENGIYTLAVPTNKRRDSPTGIIAETLPVGKKLNYTNVTTYGGSRYISWVETEPNGNKYRYFVYAPKQESPTYSESQLINEVGVATLTKAVNKRRDTPTGVIAETLPVGKKLSYTNKWIGNGHRYVSWVETEPNGNKYRYFVAVSGSEKYGVDTWATFGGPSTDTKGPQTPTSKSEIDESNVKHWGVDLSENNADGIDLSAYDFAILRSNYGEITDKKIEYWVKACEKAGIPYGLYCYDYAIDDDQAEAEAKYTLELARKYKPALGVWLDMEDEDKYKEKRKAWTKERALRTCEIFCKCVQNAGLYAGIYSSSWVFKNWLNSSTIGQYDKWVAQWDANDGDYHSDTSSMGTIHQYTSVDKHSGIGLDKNAMYVDFDHYKSKIVEKPQNETENVQKDESNESDIKELNGLLGTLIGLLKKLLSIFGKSGD